MDLPAYGYILPASRAAVILDAAGITQDTDVGPGGEKFTYLGIEYWIMQREVYYGPSDTSPDGWHIVYSPSQEEIDISKPPADIGQEISTILKDAGGLIAFGIGSWLLVKLTTRS